MTTLNEFSLLAPRINKVFEERHDAAHNLCMLATIRADGSPRISPMEPRRFEGHLVMLGMPGTLKFADLERDPRFCLHTATVDPQLTHGDVKIWGRVTNLTDAALHERFAQAVFDDIGLDLRGQSFEQFPVADINSAALTELVDDQVVVTRWDPTRGEQRIVKH